MNIVIIRGNLTRDVHFVKGQGEKANCAIGTLAVNGYKDSVDFIEIVAFNSTADFLQKYGTKGTNFIVQGRLQTQKEQENGKYFNTYRVVADRLEFGSSAKTEKIEGAEKIEKNADAENGNYLLDDEEDDRPF